jgi:hypothetical protein
MFSFSTSVILFPNSQLQVGNLHLQVIAFDAHSRPLALGVGRRDRRFVDLRLKRTHFVRLRGELRLQLRDTRLERTDVRGCLQASDTRLERIDGRVRFAQLLNVVRRSRGLRVQEILLELTDLLTRRLERVRHRLIPQTLALRREVHDLLSQALDLLAGLEFQGVRMQLKLAHLRRKRGYRGGEESARRLSNSQ